MFIINLKGGLGNQMFQWAFARALALKTNTSFFIDFEDPYRFVKRSYELHKFKLIATNASHIHLIKYKPKRRIIKRLYIVFNMNPSLFLFKEKKDYEFEENIEQNYKKYISGFWQNEKYFKNYRDHILSDFQLRSEPDKINLQHLNHIKLQPNSISLHIRRGDYVQNPKALKLHGICEMEYYKKAINHFETLNTENFYYCFSDDVNWVKENFNFLKNKIIIDNNISQPEEDLRLMSNCKHNIIANSSFSWWGAWLNSNPNKIVIAPSKWSNVHFRPDIIPNGWITF